MVYKYYKLVRDKIVNNINSQKGKKATWRTMEEDEYLEKVVEEKYKEYVQHEEKKQIVMDLKGFNKQEKVIKSRLLLYTISRLFGTTKGIEKIHIEDIIKLCEKNIGNKYLTPNKNIKVLIKNQKIYFKKQI